MVVEHITGSFCPAVRTLFVLSCAQCFWPLLQMGSFIVYVIPFLPTAYVVREEVIFSLCVSVHISGRGVPTFQMVEGGGVPTLRSGWWGGTYLPRSGGGVPTFWVGGGTYSQVWMGGTYLPRSGWGGGYLPSGWGGGTYSGLDGGVPT